jgi:hypothetical protein
MNIWKKILFITAILTILTLVLPGKALAAAPSKLVVGGSYTLSDGDTLNEDLMILGGMATLEEGSTVNGNIMVLGGTLSVAGDVNGDITATGGLVSLSDSAVVHGDVTTVGAQLNRDSATTIEGKVQNETNTPFVAVPDGWRFPYVDMRFSPLVQAGLYFLKAILWALLAMLVVMFLTSQTERTVEAITSQPLIAGGFGLLTIVIAPLVLIGLTITICLIPVAFVGLLVFVVAWCFGLIAIGTEIGKRFGRIFKQEWHPALAAGVGTLLLVLVLNGLAFITCIGWIPQVLVGMLGLGGIILTRFGTVSYTPGPSSTPLPPPSSTPVETPMVEPPASDQPPAES